MASSWNIESEGRSILLTVEPGAGGRDLVRLNGRTIAKPIGGDEQVREFAIGAQRYFVRRIATGGYELEEDATDASAALLAETATSVLAHSKESPLSMVRDALFGNLSKIGWLVIAALVAVALIYATGPNYGKAAATRVDQVLREMRDANSNMELQFAITIWAKNRRSLDIQEMSWASDNFDRWIRQERLGIRMPYEIVSSEELKGEKVPTAIVTFKIDDRNLRVRVPKDRPISWER
jgi:hypothetical protein